MMFVAVLAMYFSPMPGISVLHSSAQDRIKPSGHVSMPPLFAVIKGAVLKVWFLRFIVIVCLARVEDNYMTHHPDEVNFWYLMIELVSAFGTFY